MTAPTLERVDYLGSEFPRVRLAQVLEPSELEAVEEHWYDQPQEWRSAQAAEFRAVAVGELRDAALESVGRWSQHFRDRAVAPQPSQDLTGATVTNDALWRAYQPWTVFPTSRFVKVGATPAQLASLQTTWNGFDDDRQAYEAMLLAKHDDRYAASIVQYGFASRLQPSSAVQPIQTSSAKFGTGIQIEEASSNQITNPSFETDLNLWSSVGGSAPTVIRDTTRSYVGSASAKIAWVTGSNNGNAGFVTTQAYVNNGTTYTFSAWVYVPSGSTLPMLTLYSVSTTGTTTVNAAPVYDQWQRLQMTFTATQSGYISLQISPSANAVPGSVCWFDAVQLEQKAYATSYIDGSLGSGYTWDSSNNLLSAAASSFEDGTIGGWAATGNSTIANSTAQAYSGTHSLAVTTVATGTASYSESGQVACSANTVYTASAVIKQAVATRACTITLSWRDASHTVISSVTSPALGNTTGWARMVITGTAPSNAAYCSVFLTVPATAATNEVTYIDAIQIEQRPYATPYAAAGNPPNTSTRQAARVSYTLPLQSNPSTLCAWYKALVPNTATRGILGFVTSSGSTLNLSFTSNAASLSNYVDKAAQVAGYSVAAGDVIFIAGTWDGTTYSVYASKNGGALQSGTATGGTAPGPVTGVSLGWDGTFTDPAGGIVEQALVYNTALSAAEIQALASATSRIDPNDDPRIQFAAAVGIDGTDDLVAYQGRQLAGAY